MDIETLSTDAVKNRIAKTDRLRAYINTGEKEPSFDGYIGIFDNKNYAKKNYKKVNVQIKGTEVDYVPLNPTFPVSITDLENYKNNDGVMFFVVYIDHNGEVIDIYYNSLLPFSLQQLLKSSNNTCTISIKLKLFPRNKNEITDLLLNFYRDSQRQTSFANIEIPTIEELMKSGNLDRFTFSYSATNNKSKSSVPYELEGKELYIYAVTKDSPVPIPVQHIDTIDIINSTETVESSISINNVVFYDSYKIEHYKDYIMIIIGNSIRLKAYNFNDNNITIDFSIRVKGTLSSRIHDLEFLVELIKAKGFYISSIFFPLDITKQKNCQNSLEYFQIQLDKCLTIKKLLNTLNVKKELDIDNCTEEDFNRIDTLIDAIIDKKLKKFNSIPPVVAFYKIANISLLLFFIEHTEGIEIADFFESKAMVVVKDQNDKEYEVSQFYNLEKETILKCDNINYSKILPDFKSKEYSDVLFDQANMSMLEMLKAYDEKPSEELLSTIKDFSQWIQENPEYVTFDIAQLNHYQIILRERKLSVMEKGELFRIFNETIDTKIKIGCLILLGNNDEVFGLLQSLTDEEQVEFKSYPIWKFMKE